MEEKHEDADEPIIRVLFFAWQSLKICHTEKRSNGERFSSVAPLLRMTFLLAHVVAAAHVVEKDVHHQQQPQGGGEGASEGRTASRTASSNRSTYRVRQGDSLWEIARRNDTTVERLRAANDMRSNRIVPGPELNIPTR